MNDSIKCMKILVNLVQKICIQPKDHKKIDNLHKRQHKSCHIFCSHA